MTADDLMTVKPARSVRESEAVKALQADNEKLRELISRSIEHILGDCSGMTELEGTSDDALARDTYANAADLLIDMLPFLHPSEVQMLGLDDQILKLRNWADGG